MRFLNCCILAIPAHAVCGSPATREELPEEFRSRPAACSKESVAAGCEALAHDVLADRVSSAQVVAYLNAFLLDAVDAKFVSDLFATLGLRLQDDTSCETLCTAVVEEYKCVLPPVTDVMCMDFGDKDAQGKTTYDCMDMGDGLMQEIRDSLKNSPERDMTGHITEPKRDAREATAPTQDDSDADAQLVPRPTGADGPQSLPNGDRAARLLLNAFHMHASKGVSINGEVIGGALDESENSNGALYAPAGREPPPATGREPPAPMGREPPPPMGREPPAPMGREPPAPMGREPPGPLGEGPALDFSYVQPAILTRAAEPLVRRDVDGPVENGKASRPMIDRDVNKLSLMREEEADFWSPQGPLVNPLLQRSSHEDMLLLPSLERDTGSAQSSWTYGAPLPDIRLLDPPRPLEPRFVVPREHRGFMAKAD